MADMQMPPRKGKPPTNKSPPNPSVRKSTGRSGASTRDRDEALYVGHIIRTRRVQLHLSQTDLGDILGVTFQQIQKYEKATNGIASGRVGALCEALDIDPNTLFGFGRERHAETTSLPVLSPDAIRGGYELAQLDPAVRHAVGRLIHAMLGQSEEEGK